MGRPEQPVDSRAAKPVRDLAEALRVLRRAAGELSYRRMAALTHYSAATLARAASGAVLPSREVTIAYAAACGGERDEWAARWDRAQAELNGYHTADAGRPDGASRGPTAAALPVPRQLPVPSRFYTGRDGELAELDALLGTYLTGPQPAIVIATIAGAAGVGKTALAVHWAHRVRDRFPDGELYVNLRGYDSRQPVTPEKALDGFLRALDVPAGKIPHGLEAQAGLYRSLLASRRMLLVLDNAANTEQVRPLLPGAPGNLVIVTSRSRLSGLVARDGAHRITLRVLPEDEAIHLLRRVIGTGLADGEPVAELAWQCAYLPLALRIAAERVATRPRPCLAGLVGDLAVARDRLDLLTTEEDETTAVRTVFCWSYRSLPADAARMFRLLGLITGPETGIAAVRALAGTTPPETRRLLNILTSQHLLDEVARDRYRQHDLLHAYATERAEAEDLERDRGAAVRRLLTWYLHTADAAGRILLPQRRPVPVCAPAPHVRPLSFQDRKEALAWGEAELPNLVAATRQAAEVGYHDIAWQIPAVLWPLFSLRKAWADWFETHTIGLASADECGDEVGRAYLLTSLAQAHRDLRQFDAAVRALEEAIVIWERVDHLWETAAAHTFLAMTCQNLGRFHRAVEASLQALALFRRLDDAWGQGWALRFLGEAHRELQAAAKAIDYTGQALAFFEQSGDLWGQGWSLHTLATTHQDLRQFDDSREYFRRALAVRREIGDQLGEATTLHAFGVEEYEAGRPAKARAAWQEAAAIFEHLGDPMAEVVRARLSGAADPGEPRVAGISTDSALPA